jgi:hypothetical protein
MSDKSRRMASGNLRKGVSGAELSAELERYVELMQRLTQALVEIQKRLSTADLAVLQDLRAIFYDFEVGPAAGIRDLGRYRFPLVLKRGLWAELCAAVDGYSRVSDELIDTLAARYGLAERLQGWRERGPLLDTKVMVPPPVAACFLLDSLLAKAHRSAISGDLEEEFTTSILPKYGPTGARLWFWAEALRNIAIRNPVCRWLLVGGLARLVGWIFRQIGS